MKSTTQSSPSGRRLLTVVKQPVDTVAFTNINLIAPPTSISGRTLLPEDRVLLTAQSNSAENGIYGFNGDELKPSIDWLNEEGQHVTVLAGSYAGNGYKFISGAWSIVNGGIEVITPFGVTVPTSKITDAPATINDLRNRLAAGNLRKGGVVNVGCHTVEGWGGGSYQVVDIGSHVDNGGTVITGGVFAALFIGTPTIETFGMVGDDITDNTEAWGRVHDWQWANATSRKVESFRGTYLVKGYEYSIQERASFNGHNRSIIRFEVPDNRAKWRVSFGDCVNSLTGALATDLGGKYVAFQVQGPISVDDHYVWFNLDGSSSDPAPGGTGHVCAITTGYTASQIASAFTAVVHALNYLTASATGTAVKVVCQYPGPISAPTTDVGTALVGFDYCAFQFGVSAVPFPHYLPMSGFAITTTSAPWAALDVVNQICLGDIELEVRGNWRNILYVNVTSHLTGGGIIWGSLKLTSMATGPGGASQFPEYGINQDSGFFNSQTIHVDLSQTQRTGIRLRGSYTAANYVRITGSIQGSGRGYDIQGSYSLETNRLAEEANTNKSVVANSEFLRLTTSQNGTGLRLGDIYCPDVSGFAGPLEYTAGTIAPFAPNAGSGSIPITRVNASEISWGAWSSTGGRLRPPAGYGLVDPPNLAANGDFERFIAGVVDGAQSLWGWINPVSSGLRADQCGDNCVDTTRTYGTPHCALLRPYTTAFAMSQMILPGPLPAYLSGCPVTLSFKYKLKSGTGALAYGCKAGHTVITTGGSGGEMPCENGFTLASITCVITADMVTSGVTVQIRNASSAQYYISEVQASVGYSAPRMFTRFADKPGWLASIDQLGRLSCSVSAVPVSATDPIFNLAWQEQDYAKLISPVIGTTAGGETFQTLGWRRLGGVWVPQQVHTGLVAV